jgi:uncharacterized protein YukE
MGGSGFSVDTAALRQLAGEFEQAAQQVVGAIDHFRSSTQPASGVFGLLPAARAAHARYLQKMQEGVGGLHDVQRMLQIDLAAGLRANAANYESADEASAQ